MRAFIDFPRAGHLGVQADEEAPLLTSLFVRIDAN
jgi:hypothetical protein